MFDFRGKGVYDIFSINKITIRQSRSLNTAEHVWEAGPVSQTVSPSQFKFDGNFVSLSSRFLFSDPYKILYMTRQMCCRGMCKNLLRSDGQQQNYSKAKFPSNLNCGQKIVSETGPWSCSSVCLLRHRTDIIGLDSGFSPVRPSSKPTITSHRWHHRKQNSIKMPKLSNFHWRNFT